MVDTIVYSTVEEQIKKLQKQNLHIGDKEVASEALSLYGYSNLIKSYREPYTYLKDGNKVYRDGVTFEQLLSLYLLDKNLRNAVMSAMLDLEEHVKEIAADVIASTFGVHQDDYLQYRNYRALKTHVYRFSLKGLLETMQNTLKTDKDPIRHYAQEHGIVPPWILFKSIYFGTMINFIKHFKKSEQSRVASRLYDGLSGFSDEQIRYLMIDTLFIANKYRNLAAHGGRTYNYDCSSKLRSDEIFGDNAPINKGFNLLLFLLSLLDYKHPFQILSAALDQEINRHCSSFPEDATYLAHVLNINIEHHKWVFSTKRSKVFHVDPHCSGMQRPIRIEFEDAVDQGYHPCKRCVKSI